LYESGVDLLERIVAMLTRSFPFTSAAKLTGAATATAKATITATGSEQLINRL
jgi:hypothetical protein